MSSGGHSDVPPPGRGPGPGPAGAAGRAGGQAAAAVPVAQVPEGRAPGPFASSWAPPALLRALLQRFPSSAPPSNPGLKLLFSPYSLVKSCLSSDRFSESSLERGSRRPLGRLLPELL